MATLQARDLALSGSELLVQNGDLVLVQDAAAIVQDIGCRLRFFRGEWFLAPEEGVPWFDRVLTKNPNPDLVRSTIREALLATPGVLEVLALELEMDRTERRLAISWRVSTDVGELQGAI